jgi:hypothetical protein
VCLNCHRLLSNRQHRWHPAWLTEAHPTRYLIQGVYDVLMLWLERSPDAERYGGLVILLFCAALHVFVRLRPDVLCELPYLTDWSAQ